MKARIIQSAVAVVILAVLIFGGQALREETLSVHEEVEAGSTLRVEMTVSARGGAEADEASLAESLASLCQLEVGGRVVPGSFVNVGSQRYAFVLAPSLDESDRTQLHGCLQDMRIDEFLAHVVEMTHRPADAGSQPDDPGPRGQPEG